MGKTEQDWNELKLGFLKTVQPNSFSKFISAVWSFKNNVQGTYLFVSNLWFCHLHVISLLTLSSIAIWGRIIGKIKQNELDCRDTASLSIAALSWMGLFPNGMSLVFILKSGSPRTSSFFRVASEARLARALDQGKRRWTGNSPPLVFSLVAHAWLLAKLPRFHKLFPSRWQLQN